MAKSIVIYTSKRGSTRQYAEWIAEDLLYIEKRVNQTVCGMDS